MCGEQARPAGQKAGNRTTTAPEGSTADDYPDLRAAFTAWKSGAFEEMVQATLGVLGIAKTSPDAPAGMVGWTVPVGSAALYVYFDRARSEVVAEAPVVWIPEHQRVSLMRTLLELNLFALQISRFCLHGDTVVLRFADRIENVSPPKLLAAVREVGREAERHDNWLCDSFGARMVGPEAQQARLDWRFLGMPVELPGFARLAVEPARTNGSRPAAQILQLLDHTLALARAHGSAAGLVCRAAVCRTWFELKADSWASASLVLDGGRVLLSAPLGAEPAADQVLAWFERLLALGDVLPTLAPAPVLPIAEMEIEPAAYLSQLRALVTRLPDAPDLRQLVLLGGIAELLIRAPLGSEHARRLAELSSWARSTAESRSSCSQLALLLGEVLR
jgi:hypothetical protein